MSNNIRDIRTAKGMTMRELAERMGGGTHYTTVAKIERSMRPLTTDWVLKFAAALGVEPSEISDSAQLRGMTAARTVPLIGLVSAGNWREAVQHADGRAFAMSGGVNAFALRTEGDSMDKVVPTDAVVIVDPDQFELHEGGYYVVMNGDGETTFKQYRHNPSRLEPCSTNESHAVIPLGREQITVIGRVVGMFAEL